MLDDGSLRMIPVTSQSEMKGCRRGFLLSGHCQRDIDVSRAPGLRAKSHGEAAHKRPAESPCLEILNQPDQGLL
jgi:hypothetical protein